MPQESLLILKHIKDPNYTPDIECYLRHGGYKTWQKVLSLKSYVTSNGKEITPQELIRQELVSSGLRGRGGAGFPCGTKWSFVKRDSSKPVYLICNADESEPGTFKDRQIIYNDPHQLLEGICIASFANNVHLAFIYVRGEFYEGAKILQRAINEAKSYGFLGKNILGSNYDLEIVVHRGGGAYICGEETALIESLEGKRGYPRIKPPYYPAIYGLYQSPTIINNVETLCAVKHIIEMGASEYIKLGTPQNSGTRIVSLSGHIKRPGYYEIEIGKVTLRDLIYHPNFGNGIRANYKLKAIIPGGVSSRVLKAGETVNVILPGQTKPSEIDVLDLPYDFTTLAQAGTMSGTGAIIVLDETVSMVRVLLNIAKFFAHESCGQCTPCREGTRWMVSILQKIVDKKAKSSDIDLLESIANQIMGGRTICAFGDACAWPVESIISKFRDEFVESIGR